ncbi:histidine kinase [Glutamicibacter nicotianae]|uniref:histidine kinase n=1 Tax=Glutamicibacter nicotianae TaxID=37929 RepID=UPI0019572A69|nr:two-component system sensor histidine kinase DesK [Glutamicibacter nicotianae]
MSPRQPGSAPVDDPLCGLDEDQKFWDRRGWLVAGVWVIFLVFPVLDLLVEDHSLPTRIIGLALIALFAAVYLQSYSKFSSKIGQGGTSARRAHVNFLVLWAIIVLGIPVVGLTTMGLFPFITSFAIFLLGRRWAIAAYSAVLVLSFALPIIYGQFMDAIFLIGLNLVLMVVYAITVAAIRRSTEAEKMRSDYLLVAEQERVARDVHDGIGHSLTALNLKAQLALRLLDQEQYARARGELEQLSALAVDALDSVRTTVQGLSRQDLVAELAELRQACNDNNLEFTVAGSAEQVPMQLRSHVAWILREAVTNVLRHAHASRIVLQLEPGHVSIEDDGDGLQASTPGHGIRGMQERAKQFGASCTVGASRLGGTSVQVAFAADGNAR